MSVHDYEKCLRLIQRREKQRDAIAEEIQSIENEIDGVEKQKKDYLIKIYSQETDNEPDTAKFDRKVEKLKLRKKKLKEQMKSIAFAIEQLERHHRLNSHHLELKEMHKLAIQIEELRNEKKEFEKESDEKLKDMNNRLGAMAYRKEQLEKHAREYLLFQGHKDFPGLFEKNPSATTVVEIIRNKKDVSHSGFELHNHSSGGD